MQWVRGYIFELPTVLVACRIDGLHLYRLSVVLGCLWIISRGLTEDIISKSTRLTLHERTDEVGGKGS
jgi:hypothetical protein